MNYNLINGDEIIRRLDNDFNINHSDYITRLPQWIYQALRDIDYLNAFVPASYYATVLNYKAVLPNDLYELTGIEYNNKRLTRSLHPVHKSTINVNEEPVITSNIGVTVYGTTTDIRVEDGIEDQLKNVEMDVSMTRRYEAITITSTPYSEETYTLVPGGVELSFEEGYIWFHYYKLPYYYNEMIGGMCPYIPDNEKAIECITYYCIKAMIQRGYQHPIYNFNGNNPYTNIGLLYDKSKKAARNNINKWDVDQSQRIINLMNSALYNQITG